MRYSALVTAVALGAALVGCGSDNASDKAKPAAPATGSSSTPAAGGGSSSSSPGAAAASSPATAAVITIKDFKYSGAMTVKPGQKVTVKNEDSAAHTLTDKNKAFDTGNIAGGATGTFTAPSKAGSYSVICIYHPNMKATLVVA